LLLAGLALELRAVPSCGETPQIGAVVPPGIAVETGVVYAKGGEEDLLLDLARPAEGTGPFPGLVFVHGAGWSAGTRKDFAAQAISMAQQGYVCVAVDYRLAPKYRFPAQMEDVKCAVRWLRANAEKYQSIRSTSELWAALLERISWPCSVQHQASASGKEKAATRRNRAAFRRWFAMERRQNFSSAIGIASSKSAR
jgi:hypothetical protein